MKPLRILFPLLLVLFGPRVCAAVPATHPGDVLLPTLDGRVVLFHPENGTWEDYASLGVYHHPTGIVREPSGNFLLSEFTGSVLRLDATTGALSIVAQNGPLLYRPEDLTLGLDGAIYIAQDSDITRVDPVTGAESSVTPTNTILDGVMGIRAGANGLLYMVSDPWPGSVQWANPATLAHGYVSRNGLVASPLELEFQQDGSLLVSNWDFNMTELLRIDPGTGTQTRLASIDTTSIHGIARDASGGDYLTAVPWLLDYNATSGKLLHFDGTTLTTVAAFPFGVHAIYVFPGTGPVPTRTSTWGGIKGLYR